MQPLKMYSSESGVQYLLTFKAGETKCAFLVRFDRDFSALFIMHYVSPSSLNRRERRVIYHAESWLAFN